jgi:hypothetical protein
MDMLPEIPWLQFSQLPQIKRLPLQEQILRYTILVEELCAMKMHHSMKDCGGASKTRRIVAEGFLQQEDLYYILQEDGSKIYVTIEKEV